MSGTTDIRILDALYQPWTIDGPRFDPDEQAWVATIAELPGFLVAGVTEGEVAREFLPALRTHLLAYLESGKELPGARGPGRWSPVAPMPHSPVLALADGPHLAMA